jgi:hypothetical protein
VCRVPNDASFSTIAFAFCALTCAAAPCAAAGGGPSGGIAHAAEMLSTTATGKNMGDSSYCGLNQASATDNVGVVRIEVFANGKLVGTATGSSANINWNTAKLSKGTHTVTALAYDAAGNVGTAPAVSVTK